MAPPLPENIQVRADCANPASGVYRKRLTCREAVSRYANALMILSRIMADSDLEARIEALEAHGK